MNTFGDTKNLFYLRYKSIKGWFNSRIVGYMFGAKTEILMADGSIRCARDICIGDRIVGKDSGVTNIDIFTGYEEDIVRIVPKIGEELRCSQTHPILTECGIKKAKDINDSIRILRTDGSLTKVNNTYIEKYNNDVYEFVYEEKSDNTIITNGLLQGICFWRIVLMIINMI